MILNYTWRYESTHLSAAVFAGQPKIGGDLECIGLPLNQDFIGLQSEYRNEIDRNSG